MCGRIRTGAALKLRPLTTNREVGVFQLVMKEYDQWARLQSRYKPLKVEPHRSGHSLTAEEEERLKTVAFSKKKWRLAAHCMVVMMNTTMGFGELRQLRRRDVDMARPCVTVREGAKNHYRQRTIPLNAAARESMEYILKRWAEDWRIEPRALHPAPPATRRASSSLAQEDPVDSR